MATSRFIRILSLLGLGAAMAMGAPFTPTARADTTTIIPPKFELLANPGDTISEKLRILNPGPNNGTYSTDIQDFTASGDEGGVNFVEDPKAPRTSFSLASWMTVEPSSFTIPAGGEKTVNIVIVTPKSAEAGTHTASIQVKLDPTGQTTGGGAIVESKLNSLILLRVSGNIQTKMEITSFRTDQSYYQNGPVDFILTSKNEGNVHFAPKGTIEITNTFGKKVKELALKSANVLPNSSRAVRTTWDSTGMVGRYSATLVASYGDQNTPITANTTFIVMPLGLAGIAVAIVILIILALLNAKRIRKFLHNLTSD